ncbi:ribonuclease HIII [Ruficoccus amylovorans]|uniref:Ribonuclease n=1 Tax=Ruficoccus amylovorans TaxID=1804625 RepID=A0A842H9D9_9BACT|nr:ribonuclease HIII [Ruficoccus amylovorans]MBC2593133.1 ribonuclease HIII [Ruficoccus amylovorans]
MAKTDEDAPKKKTLYTLKLTDGQMDQVKDWCDRHLWSFYEVDYARFAFKGDGVNLVGYTSGKLVVQGKKTEDWVTYVLEGEITHDPKFGYDEVLNPEWFETHAGLDESGKGDLFGPLVSACVIADKPMIEKWREAGLQDSKKITSDAAILRLEKLIRQTKGVVVESTWAGMGRYNELYKKFGSNLNKLLAWMHAKSAENALAKRHVPWGLLDQFSKQPLVQRQLKVPDFELRMRTKAESDPVVAAASVIARAEYVRQMDKLSEEAGFKLGKGASAAVKKQGKQLVEKFGPESLGNFAKLHFRTAYEVLGLPVPEKQPWHRY